jgi:hypothetical protein
MKSTACLASHSPVAWLRGDLWLGFWEMKSCRLVDWAPSTLWLERTLSHLRVGRGGLAELVVSMEPGLGKRKREGRSGGRLVPSTTCHESPCRSLSPPTLP